MLRPALDALAYIHGMGLVHGHLTPANIMARADQVKLSVDTICRAGEPITGLDTFDAYISPERKHSAASDAWALGMTLVEVLTQHLPLWERSEESEPVVPDTLAAPFLQIARRCLRRNPSLRLKAADIASQLDPLPTLELPKMAKPASTPGNSHYFVWLVAISLLVMAILGSAKRLKHQAGAALPSSHSMEKRKPERTPERTPKLTKDQTQRETPHPSVPVPQQTALRMEPRPPIQAEKKTPAPVTDASKNNGIQQVLPNVPQKARDTIRGTVRVSVKVTVDRAGRVADAALDSPGPSPYFANLALQAARKWTFVPVVTSTENGFREWTLHFAFSATGTQTRSVQTAP